MSSPLRYLTAADGTRIAYAVHGSGPPLVYVRGWISDIDAHWRRLPRVRRYLEALGERFTVIRYDMRSNGRSQRDVLDRLAPDDWVLDLEAVMDWLDIDDAVMWATCYGGFIAARYLARHPERVSRVVLDGCYAKWKPEAENREADPTITDWTNRADHDALAQHVTDPDPGGLDPSRLRINREAVDDEALRLLYKVAYTDDFSSDYAAIAAPTLVMQRRESKVVPFSLARELASLIPGAQLVGLDGRAHNPWDGEAQEALDAMARFLSVDPPQLAPIVPTTSAMTVVLFTDVEESTSMAAQLGDDEARERLRVHERITNVAVEQKGGTRIKSTGDGILATFPSVTQALDAASQIQWELWVQNRSPRRGTVRVRIGLDAGEPVADEGELYGIVVNTAARVCDRAGPDEILVASVIRDLARGKRFNFADAGEFALKGIAEPVRLFRLDWRSSP